MPIDRAKLVADLLFWLPEENILTDTQLEAVGEHIITLVGDDETKYAEVLCKSIQAAAHTNHAKHLVDSAGLKRERVGKVETEYGEITNVNVWKGYLKTLRYICPIFGYTGLSSVGSIKISPSEKFVINDCPNIDDLFL